VSLELVEQPWAGQHIAVFAAFTALYVDNHALTVDVARFQVREFGAPESGGIEGHQQGAMQRRLSGINDSRDFLLTEYRRQLNGPLRVGCFRDALGLPERLAVEKT
jgi:hypothetical protein